MIVAKSSEQRKRQDFTEFLNDLCAWIYYPSDEEAADDDDEEDEDETSDI